MITVKEITDKNLWQEFFLRDSSRSFLHDWTWGEFQKNLGLIVFRFGMFNAEDLLGIALVIEVNSFGRFGGKFLFIPHGPLINEDFVRSDIFVPKDILLEFFSFLRNFAAKRGAWGIRISPVWKDSEAIRSFLSANGFRQAPIFLQPENEWMLDLEGSSEEIFREMRKTTRYLIRRGEEMGIKVTESSDDRDVEILWELMKKTSKRQNFVSYSKEYLTQEFKIFAKEDRARLFFGSWNDEVLSGAMVIFYKKGAVYHHGASDQKYSKIPVNYLVQWRIIEALKRRGCGFYNLHAVTPSEDPRHPWYGLSLFKKGFGGEMEQYIPAQDLPLSKKFYLTLASDFMIRFRRGFRI